MSQDNHNGNSEQRLPDGTLVLDQPVSLPQVLDMLIVGGGPTGTAAAFRAKELGLSALVIDYDDLMKRIRDYSKDKMILPSFGGGDQMHFPKGGELISRLVFEDIDKDDMCRLWKSHYRTFGIPAQIGVELSGLEEEEGGLWRVQCWNHNTKSQQSFQAKHVVISVGRGVPRRFDISGNLDGIAFKLSDPERHSGGPACVIGGGTSAAEAVIAISNAKAQAGDPSAVFWSYRGERMPKVSRALAEVFLEAFAGNGNIRYLPKSEPVSVFQAPDGREFLCLRIARKEPAHRPVETIHLEFAKQYCVACIGEDLPLELLASLGIHRVSGGPKNRQRLAVTPLLETGRPNLYLAGDTLSPAYLETENLDGDPAGFREVKRRGNIKAALRDGVLVAEVIAQKLAGKTDIHVKLEFGEGAAPSAAETARRSSRTEARGQDSGPRLIRILDGQVQSEEYSLSTQGPTTIGNRHCDINFEQDTLLSDRHASIFPSSKGYRLCNEADSTVFLQPAAGRLVEVADRAVLRAGNQWLVFGDKDNLRSVAHYDSQGREVQRIRLAEKPIVAGRQAADVILDSSDGTLSRRHLAMLLRDGKRFIRDLESVNGTLLKVESPTWLTSGDRIWMGREVLEFYSEEEAAGPSAEVHLDTQAGLVPEEESQAGQPQRSAAADGDGLTVRFLNLGKTLTLRPGQTVCELAEEHGLKLKAQCHRGICGSDPIRIISGQENLNPMGEGEEETLDDLCALDDGHHRLACMARPSGPVVVEILE
ncbi:MAG TPA: NAD(P)-binding domain-containing protein [Acidobacteriota bacterium]|nr:NAD(P)-binding domain-containing protein [Acidobacteriota bacterium]